MYRRWHRSYPEGVPYEVEIPSISLYQLLEQSTRDFPANKAVVDGDRELTYEQLKDACDRLAAALYRRGFRKGDRMALMLPNSMEYIISYYAVHRLGGVVVQVNPMYQPSELKFLLQDSEATWLIGCRAQTSKLDQAGLADQLTVVYADDASGQPGDLFKWITEENNELPPLDINAQEDLAVLQYTGGTTGTPKGVMLTHFNLVSVVYQTFVFSGGLRKPGERILGMLPLFHVYGMSRMNTAIFNGQTYICMARFEVNHLLDLIRQHRPTIFPAVPTVYIALLNHPGLQPGDLDSIQNCGSGSAPLPVEVIREFERKTGLPIMEGYGLSETSPTTHVNPVGRRKVGSIGLPIPNTDCKIVDVETGMRELPPGEPGELVIKGPQVMKGYWKKPEETALVLKDGWFYTGDIAKMDDEGYFYIVGRKKEMIIAGGYNIYPIEIEEILYQHPAVGEACVYGVPDPYRGETVKAVIVPKKNTSLTEEEIADWCKERLAKYKVPRWIEFRSELPKSTVGKILRRKLLEEEQEKQRLSGEDRQEESGSPESGER
ncbi:long-chain-fatty-acid--CoA ligase [Lihuaxuella thermophila]|uniref:Long-chain acyl-CoA synthetase n=1 Tax=Lihuaxuella thermophila TaxID=1173111 RepID=A0A1H8GFG2_9BACL|nr:long-chain fatty acid--CoA ligase [Lihuaxuella thermophila]SEN42732.1 long-chain acyl-CoA synthetase [Lihuaxuella thermophila]